jgi:GT2 family glycosyltransferase
MGKDYNPIAIDSLYSVVVNWNLKEDTVACVESLFAAGALSGQVIVVDNGSSDDSVTGLQKHFGSSLHIIQSERNLGFAGGNNLGIQYALNQGADWILILNNDTYLAPTFLVEMMGAVKQNEKFSIIGPVILYHDIPDRIWYFGDRLIPGLLATISLYRGQTYHERFPSLVPVDFVSGCCMLIKSDVFKRIGLFDTTYFMYGEDVDFCWRARTNGFHLAVATRAKMWHKVSVSANRDQLTSRYLRIRNQIHFYRTYSKNLTLFAMFTFTWLRMLGIALGDLFYWRPSLVPPLIRGWLHGWIDDKTQNRVNDGIRSV